VDDLLAYIDENRKIFDAGINAIPGLTSMPLEATYLAWWMSLARACLWKKP
jgi:cystathionine beta-lyase